MRQPNDPPAVPPLTPRLVDADGRGPRVALVAADGTVAAEMPMDQAQQFVVGMAVAIGDGLAAAERTLANA